MASLASSANQVLVFKSDFQDDFIIQQSQRLSKRSLDYFSYCVIVSLLIHLLSRSIGGSSCSNEKKISVSSTSASMISSVETLRSVNQQTFQRDPRSSKLEEPSSNFLEVDDIFLYLLLNFYNCINLKALIPVTVKVEGEILEKKMKNLLLLCLPSG